MAGSPFDVHRAEPSQQQSVGTPPLDMRRAELSRQHVRALNTQFARSFLFYSSLCASFVSAFFFGKLAFIQQNQSHTEQRSNRAISIQQRRP